MNAATHDDRFDDGGAAGGAGRAKPALAATARLPILPQRPPDPAELAEMVREAAYFRAMRRGFAPGHELDDWLAAEREVAQQFA